MARLVNYWQISQPKTLKHLAVIRDAAQLGKVGFYIHYTHHAFEEKVLNGEVVWDAVKTIKTPLVPEEVIDRYGFTVLNGSQFQGRFRNATLAECIEAVRGRGSNFKGMSSRAINKAVQNAHTDASLSSSKDKEQAVPRKGIKRKAANELDGADKPKSARPRGRPRKYPKINLELEEEPLTSDVAKSIKTSQKRAWEYLCSKIGKEIEAQVLAGVPEAEAQSAVVPQHGITEQDYLTKRARKRRKAWDEVVSAASLPLYLPSIAAHSMLLHSHRPNDLLPTDSVQLGNSRSHQNEVYLNYRPSSLAHGLSLNIGNVAPAKVHSVTRNQPRPNLIYPPTLRYLPSIAAHDLSSASWLLKSDGRIAQEPGAKSQDASALNGRKSTRAGKIPQKRNTDESLKTPIKKIRIEEDSNNSPKSRSLTYKEQSALTVRANTGIFLGPNASLRGHSGRGRPRKCRLVIFKLEAIYNLPWFCREPSFAIPQAEPVASNHEQMPAVAESNGVSPPLLDSPNLPAAIDFAGPHRGFRGSPVALLPQADEAAPVPSLSVSSVLGVSRQDSKRKRGSAQVSGPRALQKGSRSTSRGGGSLDCGKQYPAETVLDSHEVTLNGSCSSPGPRLTGLGKTPQQSVSGSGTLESPVSVSEDSLIGECATLRVQGGRNQQQAPKTRSNPSIPEDASETAQSKRVEHQQREDEMDQNHDVVNEAIPATRHLTQSPAKMRRFGGSTARARKDIIMDVIRKCGGLYPSGNELTGSVTEVMLSNGVTAMPDKKTIQQVKKVLVAEGKLHEINFTFQDRRGLLIQKTIVALAGLDPQDSKVKDLQNSIRNSHPLSYFPASTFVNESSIDSPPAIAQTDRTKAAKSYANLLPIETESVKSLFPKTQRKHTESRDAKQLEVSAEVSTQPATPSKSKALPQSGKRCPSKLQGQGAYPRPQGEHCQESPRKSNARRRTQNNHQFPPEDRGERPQEISFPETQISVAPKTKARRRTRKDSPSQLEANGKTSWEIPPPETQNPVGTACSVISKEGETTQKNTRAQKIDRSIVLPFANLGGQQISLTPSILLQDLSRVYATPKDKPVISAQATKKVFNAMVDNVAFWEQNTFEQSLPFETSTWIHYQYPGELDGSTYFAPPSAPIMPQDPCPSLPSTANLSAPVAQPTTSSQKQTRKRRQPASPNTTPMGQAKKRKIQKVRKKFNNPRTVGAANGVTSPFLQEKEIRQEPEAPKTKKTRRRVAFSIEDERPLLIAIIITRALLGGVELSVNWDVVAKMLDLRYEPAVLKRRWSSLRTKFKSSLDWSYSSFRKAFLKAYRDGSIPTVDFDHFMKYDWSWLHKWTMKELDDSSKASKELPSGKKSFNSGFNLRDSLIAPHSERVVANSGAKKQGLTIPQRHALAHKRPRCVPIAGISVRQQDHRPLEVAKSWVIANVITPQETYNPEFARRKLSCLEAQVIDSAVSELLSEKKISQENKGRALPARTYKLSDQFTTSLKSTLGPDDFAEAIAFKLSLDSRFRAKQKVSFNAAINDGEMVALVNLVADSMIRSSQEGLPSDKFGLTGKDYRTRNMDKEKLSFEVLYRPDEQYKYGLPLAPLPQIPNNFSVHGMQGTMAAKVPIWVDINGDCNKAIWDLVLSAILTLLTPGTCNKARDIERSLESRLEELEVLLVFGWLVNAGAATWTSDQHNSVQLLPWWWTVFG